MPWAMELPLEWGELAAQAGDGDLVEPEDIPDRLDERLDPRPPAGSSGGGAATEK